ncbi:unnamed protein product [Pleuronectes platessa]|uniref:Uncharacterized protein n=1 Tax=Pleuronectes platessa TaxID=8262 RepID=A0A9N7V824_PLEPL|nr:unnamed protein product [Pleuronectes platessa]
MGMEQMDEGRSAKEDYATSNHHHSKLLLRGNGQKRQFKLSEGWILQERVIEKADNSSKGNSLGLASLQQTHKQMHPLSRYVTVTMDSTNSNSSQLSLRTNHISTMDKATLSPLF